ncbi:hypothetical protein L249_6167 [Ophiocordyceps polyrhachis-furcata BCC 54312]|uniref:Cnl2/NKP2 family protein n=1 Tax=Ophiocordyceps polyrhachis-furcata BCC 54312 TaxID=1330021 RepID=A0A367LJ38_9HYPO|nr:hypothetical protein L249_6167 [Ophiocordyceps polyrhachis-furcata BCC 54312]
MTPPTEKEILTNYLVQTAPLTAVISFSQFQTAFPRSHRDSPLVRSLYRDLQAQRAATVDAVSANIAQEVERGAAMQREVLRLRREAQRTEPDAELDIERALSGPVAAREGGSDDTTKGHSLRSVLPELEGAVKALEAEIRLLSDEQETLCEGVRQTISGLSDLRYGKFANGAVKGQVDSGLDSLCEACQDKA